MTTPPPPLSSAPEKKDKPQLSAESLAAIEREVKKYPRNWRRSAVMSALRIAQKERGWLPRETIEFVADYLGIPAIRAFEVASFYNMYDLRPVGRIKICLCTNLPCALMGAEKTAAALKESLGVEFGGTTPDGEFTLKEGECFGACGDAPVAIINNERMQCKLTPDEVPSFLESLKNGAVKGGE